MKLRVSVLAAIITFGPLSAAQGATLFEETVAMKSPPGTWLMRNWMGDFLMRKDGTP